MSLENPGSFSKGPEKKIEKPEMAGLKFVSEQMDEAIKAEDYKQAAFLRDTKTKLEKNNEPLPYIREEDILDEQLIALKKINFEDLKDKSEFKAWEGIKKKQQADMYAGKDIIKSSSFASYLGNKGESAHQFIEELWKDIKYYKRLQDPDEKADYLSSLYGLHSEAKELINIAELKIDNISQTYDQREPIVKFDDEKLLSQFPGLSREVAERSWKMDQMPDFISKPLEYWRRIYDDTSQIADELEVAIKEMK
jgi:chromatin remodeling complex protein RSC6